MGGFLGLLYFVNILDWCVFVWVVLRLLGVRVDEFDMKIGNVVVRFEVESVFDVFPVKVYSYLQITFPIIGDFIMFLDDIAKMTGMLFFHVFNVKVVYN